MSETQYLYLNIFKHTNGEYTIGHYHATRQEADVAAENRDDRVSCLKVPFREGQIDPPESFFLNVNEYGDTYTLSQALYKTRKDADNAKTRSSRRVACIRLPLVDGRFDP
jgi:hypothetical protein